MTISITGVVVVLIYIHISRHSKVNYSKSKYFIHKLCNLFDHCRKHKDTNLLPFEYQSPEHYSIECESHLMSTITTTYDCDIEYLSEYDCSENASEECCGSTDYVYSSSEGRSRKPVSDSLCNTF